MTKREKGKQRIKEILGEDVSKGVIDLFTSISPDFKNYVVDFAYGELHARPGLSDKLQEFAIVACLIGQRNNGLPLRAHFHGMFNVGWTKEEVLEMIMLLIGYAGFPDAVGALLTLKEVIDER